MAYVATSTQAGFLLIVPLKLVFAEVKGYLERRTVYEKTYAELSNLGDRELADIGIARGNIEQIALEHAANV